MNAWLPQISYPCGKFSDTSQPMRRIPKGSIGHAFTVTRACSAHHETTLSPFSLRELSELTEIAIGHLWCSLTDVPPQPNSQPVDVPTGSHLLNNINTQRVSSAASNVVVFHRCLRSHILYSTCATVQTLARVNLNRVFLPFRFSQARSLDCRFAGR